MATMPICSITSVPLERHLSMNGGSGAHSYANNSSLQAAGIQFVERFLMQALDMFQLPSAEEGPLHIADLGCSVGTNTVTAVNSVVNKLQRRFGAERAELPDFQAFFVDLPSNDFNTLFGMMLPNYIGSSCDGANDLRKRSYFVAGVPGSFYKRLFPSKSLHVVVAYGSVHWLSKVPSEVQEESSPSWNKGSVWICNANRDTRQAYAEQAHKDLVTFLNHRACEMVSGGVLFILSGSHEHSEENPAAIHSVSTGCNDATTLWCHLAKQIDDAWEEMANEGLVDISTRDAFNAPVYMRSVKEIEQAVKESGAFSIHVIDNEASPKLLDMVAWQNLENPVAHGKWIAAFTRSLFSPLLEAQIGRDLTHQLFRRVERLAAAPEQMDLLKSSALSSIMTIISLVRT
ncbi:hypothetical protein O6H91_03G010500 [Diphasiastrum complanatum]|uniref:Uncharacterized protein n=2 Tax=Diphasiastrum complanatum TaxID=34168 RepID=A0ACC2E3D1_DIPCM|nr:hypothetical protein O6H91_03G009700 [Diphasiastrum complanatum]KAJ7561011.1 hypothetical protein O6H91_03G010500 [Diphasiastrum complanatum]